jgi:hypothetical protein
MIDDCSMIAYRAKDNEEYNYHYYKFKGNSKSWRQCVYLDTKTKIAIFSRQYPSSNNVLAGAIRELLEKQMSDYFDLENKWNVYFNKHGGYNGGCSCVYHDVREGYEHKFIRHVLSKREPELNVGRNIKCLYCEGEISEPMGRFLHSSCAGKL